MVGEDKIRVEAGQEAIYFFKKCLFIRGLQFERKAFRSDPNGVSPVQGDLGVGRQFDL